MKKFNRKKGFILLCILIAMMTAACSSREIDGDKTKETNEIIVGASMEPHGRILNSNVVKNGLEQEGYTIKVVEYTDYIQPNHATQNGSLDANFFQHQPYLDDFNKNNKTNLVSVAAIHFEPLGIYPGKISSLAEIKEKAVVAVPNDVSNEGRALLLLEQAGLIKLKQEAGLNATVKDITDNPYALQFKEIEAAQAPKVLKDVDLAVINGNYALEAGLAADEDALLIEEKDSPAAQLYPNVLVVKAGNEASDKIAALKKVLKSEETRNFVKQVWKGAVVPIF